MPKSKSSIPDRWENYSNIGEVIEGTQFITFKVPLKETIQVPAKLKFTPSMLADTLESRQVQLKLVIDLTNTERYYNRQELENKGVSYCKIFVPGHVIPAEDIFDRFAQTVDSFLEEYTSEECVVGVHCTHGVNRTGYMVCRYMIEKLGFEPDMAIAAYNTARGYPIERENYLEDLQMRKAGEHSGQLTDETESQGGSGSRYMNKHHRHRNRQYNRNDRYQHNGYPGNTNYNQYWEGQNGSYSGYKGDHRHYDRRNSQWEYDEYPTYGYQNYKQQVYGKQANRHQHTRTREPASYPAQGNTWTRYSSDSYSNYQRNKDQGHRRFPYSRQNSKGNQ